MNSLIMYSGQDGDQFNSISGQTQFNRHNRSANTSPFKARGQSVPNNGRAKEEQDRSSQGNSAKALNQETPITSLNNTPRDEVGSSNHRSISQQKQRPSARRLLYNPQAKQPEAALQHRESQAGVNRSIANQSFARDPMNQSVISGNTTFARSNFGSNMSSLRPIDISYETGKKVKIKPEDFISNIHLSLPT